MRIGFAMGGRFQGRKEKIYNSLEEAGYPPEFILYCFPEPPRFSSSIGFKSPIESLKSLIYKLVYRLTPIGILKMLFRSWLPHVGSKTYHVKGVNSDNALKVFLNERPSAVIIVGCGIVRKRLCEMFHNVLLNAHAGKLPEFRGMNNVEWAYLEDTPLVGTVHFIASGIDKGDIVCEQELQKERKPKSISEIREKAFDQVFAMFPRAAEVMHQSSFVPIKQTEARTTRYVMHPFLKHMLKKKLKISE